MTSSISFSKSSSSISLPLCSIKELPNGSEKLISLFRGMIPISDETTDYQNNHSRLWVLKNGTLLGTVAHSDGKITGISSNKIINSCTGKPISLENLKRLQELQIDLAYVSEQKKLVIFPHLRAAGDDQKIAQVAAKTLNPKPPASWAIPPFEETAGRFNHMFRRKRPEGHFTEDTPENRAYIRAAVSDPSNRESINNFGVELYSKIMPDGYRAWAQVRNGIITNGGRDKPWRKWVVEPNDLSGPGGKVKSRNICAYDKFIFQERIQADRLTEVYNKSVVKNPWKPHSVELRFPARDVGGVRHQTGIILDLLKELEEGVYDEYMFFLPAGENLLSKEEILQIAQEIARGVYIHDTIPFFSLNMNTDYQLYPIVHPEYQNTYVGYVIAMLDFYLKGFWSGQLFQEEFVQNWHNDPKTGERFLREHSFPIQSKLASFDTILRNLAKEEGISVEQLASMSRVPMSISCRIIGQQKEVNKAENLFVIDSDVDLIHTLEGTPDGEEEEAYFNLLDRACGILCRKIKEVGFALPEVKKWLEAVKMMNFFSSYYRTLQEGDKVPRFKENNILGKERVCPPIFPPIPYARGPFVEFNAAGILKSLYTEERNVLIKFLQTERAEASQKEQAKAILVNLLKDFSVEERADRKLSSVELDRFASAMLISLKESYFFTERRVEKGFVNLKIKKYPYQKLPKSRLLVGIDLAKELVAKEKLAQLLNDLKYNKDDENNFKPLKEKQKELKKLSLWIQDPLNALVDAEKWFFDLEHNRLDIREKKPNGEFANVFGGYEPRLEDIESKQSALAAQILKTHAKKLSSLESEEFLVLKKESGRLFKLPVEDTFPVSSHGISYSEMMLIPSLKSSDEAFLSALHSIKQSDKQTFTNVGMVDWNRLDAFGRGALHYASIAGWDSSNWIRDYATGDSFFILRMLIDRGVDLFMKDAQGWTAMHYAAAVGNFVALGLFLDAEKGLLNLPALNGETPLYLAVQKNHLPCVKMLLEAGADLSIKPMHGWNVLMSAIHNGHEEMALFLVKTGKIDLQSSWREGKTALHFAIEMQMEKLLKELLNRGVDRNQIYNGQSPVCLASAQNWQRGIALLLAEKTENQNSWCSVM